MGNLTGGHERAPDPAIPVGWLLSIALRHIHTEASSPNPAEAWKDAAELAIDFAASMDCQRYNPFDGFSLEAPDFLPALAESLAWRELFTLPQVPPSALPTLRDAFSQIVWAKNTDNLRRDVDGLFRELDHLLEHLSDLRLTKIPRPTARAVFPLLWQHGCAPRGAVNARYLDPFGTCPRDHERYVFFQGSGDRVFVLPPSLTAAAACETVFRLVWQRAESAAHGIVADTIEKSIAIACRAQVPCVWEKLCYHIGKKRLEMDVAVRDGQDVVLFEAKAKALTSSARTGNLLDFIDDYTKSFLALLGQLVRHDRNIKLGLTPLTEPGDDPAGLHVRKIAVSPLSFGPASDHVLTNAILHAMARARLESVDGGAEHVRILNAFNEKIGQIMEDIDHIAPREAALVDSVRYMMHVSWFDLGQLLYALHRGHSVTSGVSILSHLTFNTRDFWTEVAFADRKGLTKGRWRPPPGRQHDP